MATRQNRYTQLIEKIFLTHYRKGNIEVAFERTDIELAAQQLGIQLPKNLGDVIYSFRYRTELPAVVVDEAPEGYEWVILSAGRSRYRFVLASASLVSPSALLAVTKIPDATPGVIRKYALSDEQALLAILRYNRLVDIFAGLTCYSLQSHLRTTVSDIGQIEIDELYIGLDKRGAHYVLPVQAKGAKEKVGIVQIEQDWAMCAEKFPQLVCRPIASQFMKNDVIALFEFERTEEGMRLLAEKHYRLVSPDELTYQELESYRKRSAE